VKELPFTQYAASKLHIYIDDSTFHGSQTYS